MNNPKSQRFRNATKLSHRRSFNQSLTAGLGEGPVPDEFYKDLIDEIAEGIVSLDLDGVILFANKAASKMLDLPPLQIVGRHFGDFIDKPSMLQAQEFFKQVKEGKTIMQRVINIKGKGPQVFPVEFSTSPNIENGRVVQIYSVFRNISERKEMEALVLESEKMSAIEHFITGTAQEIRNPLKGLSDRLDKLLFEYERKDFEYIGYKEFKNLFDLIRNMRDQAKYCFETTQRLLDISKRKIGKDEHTCQINHVIKEVLEKLKYNVEDSGIQLRFRLARELPDAKISAIELSQVAVNILRNAIQSITHAGKIVIKTSYATKDKMVVLECIDNGVGISKEDLSRIFEPFYTTKSRGREGSSGLGLSIVYAIVKKHKGTIKVQSSLREGTRVAIRFPAISKRTHKIK